MAQARNHEPLFRQTLPTPQQTTRSGAEPPGRTFHTQGRADCNTPHVVYLIECKKCNRQYVGQTSLSLKNDSLNTSLKLKITGWPAPYTNTLDPAKNTMVSTILVYNYSTWSPTDWMQTEESRDSLDKKAHVWVSPRPKLDQLWPQSQVQLTMHCSYNHAHVYTHVHWCSSHQWFDYTFVHCTQHQLQVAPYLFNVHQSFCKFLQAHPHVILNYHDTS